nr:PREDICTED: tyrosine-protein phosphatase non-receptor type 18-like [Latimeria chalumnae]|eukprot:XP_014353416.1 PREDICTED: tyrosine-protein phosphatase non-receptor type 18-like [Latimeria chalumnae]
MEDRLRNFLERFQLLKESDGVEDGFAKEFNEIKYQCAQFKKSDGFVTTVGGSKENLKKNRYKDILPYDQTRVILSLLVEEGETDYINANFVKGPDNERCYITTQGPLSQTVVDFWRMIWEYRVKVIIMGCREFEMAKKKCECYWASHRETLEYGPFTVTNVKEEEVNEETVIRMLSVTFCDESRVVYQFQYTAWPDHGIPDSCDCILQFIELMHEYQGRDKTPFCIHCSAGCGRTGVICAVDYVRQLLLTSRIQDDFSIFNIILEMRKQRPAAVQTKEQYEFVYQTVAELFQKKLNCSSHDYENLSMNHTPLYNNVGSLSRTCPPRVLPRTLLPLSCPATVEYPQQQALPPSPQRANKPNRNMDATYATVNKNKGRPHSQIPTSPANLPSPQEEFRPKSLGVNHYDNVRKSQRNSISTLSPEMPIYSSVRPKTKANSQKRPVSTPVRHGEGSSASAGTSGQQVDPGYSSPGPPAFRNRASETESSNYSEAYVPGQDTSSTGKNVNKLRTGPQTGFIVPSGKKGKRRNPRSPRYQTGGCHHQLGT